MLTGANSAAYLRVTEPGYTGPFTVGNSTPATATATYDPSTAVLTIAASATGTTTITLADSANNTTACPVRVST